MIDTVIIVVWLVGAVLCVYPFSQAIFNYLNESSYSKPDSAEKFMAVMFGRLGLLFGL